MEKITFICKENKIVIEFLPIFSIFQPYSEKKIHQLFIFINLHYYTLFFPRVKLIYFYIFLVANYDPVFSFFLTRQVSEKILNESSKNTIKCPNWVTLKFKVYVVSLIISVVCKTGFGIFLAHLVCLKSEK
jgi:hypothetical protein